MEKAIEILRDELAKKDAERAKIASVINTLEALCGADGNSPMPVLGGPVWPGVDIDFAGATNLEQRVLRIAEAVPGPLRGMDIALCIIQRGLSKATPDNLRSHIVNLLREHPAFERVGVGEYAYNLAGKTQTTDSNPNIQDSSGWSSPQA